MGTITPKFPNAIATDSWLTIASNQLQTKLAVPCGVSDTTLGVIDASRIVQWSLLTLVDASNGSSSAGVSEIVLVTLPPSGNILTVQRGYDGTTPKAHAAGASVNGYVVAWHQKSLAAEVEAIENTLGPNLANVGAGIPGVYVAGKFAFTPQFPGGNLIVGNNSITLSPVPQGVNGTDTDHWLYIDQGTGTPEPVKITGGSAVAGSPTGTLIVNCAFAHSGAWRIGTATSGISEAIWAMTAGVGGKVAVGSGTQPIHAAIKRRMGMPIWVDGQGQQVTILAVASDFPLSLNGVFDWSPGDPQAVPVGGASNLTIQFIQPDSTNVSTYTHWPPGIYTSGTFHSEWDSITMIAAWDMATIPTNTNGAQFSNILGSFFHRALSLDQVFDTTRVHDWHTSTVGLTNNQITAFLASSTGNVTFYIGRADDLKLADCTSGTTVTLDMHAGSDGKGGAVQVSNLWGEGEISMATGSLEIVNSHLAGSGSVPIVSFSGGLLHIVNTTMLYVGTGTAIVAWAAYQSVSAGGTYPSLFSMSNCRLDTQTQDIAMVFASTSGSYTGTFNCFLTGNYFFRSAGIVYANAAIQAIAGTGDTRLTAIGNRMSAAAGGSGVFLQADTDTFHVITGNDGGGYGYSLPATGLNLQWFGNNDFASNVHRLHDPLRLQSGTATAAAGAATLNTQCGIVTSESLTTPAGAAYVLTLTNSLITANSIVLATSYNGTNTQGVLKGYARATPAAGSVQFAVFNDHATQAFNGTIKFQYLVINPS